MIVFLVGIPVYLVILVNLVDLVILVNMGKSVDFFEYGDSGNLDEFNDFVEDCQNSDFGMVPLVVPADMVILVIQVNLVIGEYDITWDSGDPGEFGDSGYFYEPADSCASDYFSKTVNSDS